MPNALSHARLCRYHCNFLYSWANEKDYVFTVIMPLKKKRLNITQQKKSDVPPDLLFSVMSFFNSTSSIVRNIASCHKTYFDHHSLQCSTCKNRKFIFNFFLRNLGLNIAGVDKTSSLNRSAWALRNCYGHLSVCFFFTFYGPNNYLRKWHIN